MSLSAMKILPDPHNLTEADVVERHGYQIRLSHVGLEWMAFVARPKQRPTLIMAPDREAVLAKADEWIEMQLKSAKSAS
ncbi:hypothetical protein ACD578_27695 (plasmid) [Microvirga sp. RSM25]|uniref:hypothetical protein n=1 Tax=Microvirga sp. RSM25 TaxID=3273802 RepID=UPI0038513F28